MKPNEILQKFPLLHQPLSVLCQPGRPDRIWALDRLNGILDGLHAAGALDQAEHSSMVRFVIRASVSHTLVLE